MPIVIDANVVAGFYKESVLGIGVGAQNNLTATAIPIFETLGADNICYLDDGTMIENEWRGPVPSEWFDAWFAQLLASGRAQLIPAAIYPTLENSLYKKGFPRGGSRDIWYVRVCKTVLEQQGIEEVPLITEDIDFYDPTKKGCNSKTRCKILQNGNGQIVRLLRKQGIVVTAVCNN